MKLIILMLIMFLPLTSFAHDEHAGNVDSIIKIQYGIAMTPKLFNSSVKSVNIGYYSNLRKALSWNVNGGYFGDNNDDVNAGYACAQFGAALHPFSWAFVENYFGPCYFHGLEDSKKLSGNLQFATNIGAGWRDPETGSEIGLNFKHFSNAGIKKPNLGVDLFMLSLAFGL